jgi:DNA-binding transcriptional MerR regulator
VAQAVLSAFTEEQASRLAKVSTSQLAYWDRTGFFRPTLADENRRLKFSRNYTFLDVVGLRTLGMLINEYGISTRYLRRVRECLRLPQESWANITLYVLGKRVYLEEPDLTTFREPTTGQLTLKNIPLRRVLGEVEREVVKLRDRDPSQFGKVEKHKFVARNSTVFKGTRVPINTVRQYLSEGFTYDDILREFPSLTLADIKAAETHLGIGAA